MLPTLPMRKNRYALPRQPLALLPLMAALLLAACGGGSNDDNSTAPRTPLLGSQTYASAQSLSPGSALLLRYRMQAVRGGDTEASALLLLPKGQAPAGGWPLVVWAHGTKGVSDGCAPSRDYDDDQDKDYPAALLGQGFAVLAPDYEGLGGPGVHPYLSLASQGRSITAAVQAAHGQSQHKLSAGWAVVGHSQGGFAALAAAEHAPAIAATHPLRAVVALAPGAEFEHTLPELFAQIDTLQQRFDAAASGADEAAIEALGEQLAMDVFSTSYNGLMLVLGLQAQQPALTPELLLDPAALPLARLALEDGDCKQLEERLAQAMQAHGQAQRRLDNFPGLPRRDLLNLPGVLPLLQQNNPGQTRLAAPVLMIQGKADGQTPLGAARRLAARMQAAGTSLRYEEIEGDHGAPFDNGREEVLSFLRQQLGR